MVNSKIKELKEMNKSDREKRLQELKMELIKSQTSTSKTGSKKTKEIKKVIARILTFNAHDTGVLKNK